MIYKINNLLKKILLILIIFHFVVIHVLAQSNIGNQYGLNVVDDVKVLQSEIVSDSNKKMIDIKKQYHL